MLVSYVLQTCIMLFPFLLRYSTEENVVILVFVILELNLARKILSAANCPLPCLILFVYLFFYSFWLVSVWRSAKGSSIERH
jgi:hypothetical protein